MKMNGMAKKVAAALILAGGVAGFASMGAAEEPQSAVWSRGLEGTWLVEVTLRNCSTQAEVAPPFTSLLTFARGGTATETTAAPAFFPAVRGPGHGVWSSTGKDGYRASTLALITLNGALIKTQTITQKIDLGSHAQDFTSSATIQFDSPAGAPIANGCATAIGTRFE